MSFIEIASILHSNKYNYDKVIYVNNNIGVIINCPIHGDFIQLPKVHLRPNGCSKCSGKSKKTNEEFVLEASVVFNNRYNYDKSIYLNNTTDVIITCDIHGDFLKSPKLHLRGVGCNKCSNTFRYDRNSYIGKCIEVHGDKYDYSNTKYNKSINKIEYLCRKCDNNITQRASEHIKFGCHICNLKKRLTINDFIERSNKIHNYKYDYSVSVYLNYNTDLEVLCKLHGIFKQKPIKHLNYRGCPKCSFSNGEKKILRYLESNSLKYIHQKTFDGLIHISKLRYDFYLPDYNLCIEYNGKQHYESVEWFGGEESLELTKKRDFIKKKYCLDNNIKLLIIRYDQNITDILNSHLE